MAAGPQAGMNRELKMTIKTVKQYEIEISEIKLELGTLPEGRLSKKRQYYYQTIGSVHKGLTKKPGTLRQLARKAYLRQRLAHLEWNFTLIKKLYGRYKTENPAEIIGGLTSLYQTLPAGYFFHPSVHEMDEHMTAGEVSHRDKLVYITDSGICVRSKSERTIANMLDQNKVPYRYEKALVLGGANRYPDFTICRPYDGKMIIWEHLGLMDQDGYRQNAIAKLAMYAKHGFFPFDNMICSYEHDLLDPARIQALIEMLLI